MSEERDFAAIRDALSADEPGPVPMRLRARMAAIPDELAGDHVSTGWRQRIMTFAVPAAVLAAVALIVMVFGGISQRGQQTASVVPTTGPSAIVSSPSVPAATASSSSEPSAAPSASSSTTAQPSAAASLGTITLDPSQVTRLMQGTFAVRDNVGYVRWQADTVSWPTLLSIDLANSQNSKTLVVLKNGHDIASYALTDAGIAWLETWYTEKAINCTGVPCSPHMGQPVSWALNLTTLDGTTTRLDAGVVSRTSVEGEGAGPLPPEMAAQGSRVAYAIPRGPIQGAPEASQILVRSLPDGALVRKIDTDGYVAQIGLLGQAIAFRNALDTAGPASVLASDATLYLSTTDPHVPTAIASHVAETVIGDGSSAGQARLAWTPYDQNPTIVHIRDLASGSTSVIRASAGATGPAGYLSIIGDGLAWIAQVPDASGAFGNLANAWHPGWAFARPIPGFGLPDTLTSTGDTLLVSSGNSTFLPADSVGAVPASVLFGTP